MGDESVWKSLLLALDFPDSVNEATNTLKVLLNQAGGNERSAAARLAAIAPELKTPEGKRAALGVLTPYAPNTPECVQLALELSREEDEVTRLSAASFLAGVHTNPIAQARIFELITDTSVKVRNRAIETVGRMNLAGGPEGAASVLYVIPNDAQREEAIRLLDELERAVKTLQDLGLEEGQDQIVNELILPNLATLKGQFGAESSDLNEVIEERKRGIITLSGVVGSAKALAFATPVVATADKAIKNVQGAAEAVLPLLEAIKGLI